MAMKINHPCDNPFNKVILKFVDFPNSAYLLHCILTTHPHDHILGFVITPKAQTPIFCSLVLLLSSKFSQFLIPTTLAPWPHRYSNILTSQIFFCNQQYSSFPFKPTYLDRLPKLSCLLTSISLHCFLSTTFLRNIPTLSQPFNPLSPSLYPAAAPDNKNQAALRVGSTIYSWLQNSSDLQCHPTKLLLVFGQHPLPFSAISIANVDHSISIFIPYLLSLSLYLPSVDNLTSSPSVKLRL